MSTIHKQPSDALRPSAVRSQRTQELFDLAADADDAARRRLIEEIIELNIPIADSMALRYVGRGIAADDLAQVARLALVRVTRSFRRELGADFLCYAVPSIRGALRRHFRDAGWVVRPPRRLQEAEYKVNKSRGDLAQMLGREPTAQEIALEVDLDEDTVNEALALGGCFTPDSLDKSRSSDDGAASSAGDRLGHLDDNFDQVETRTMLAPLMAGLSGRDRQVLRLRFVEGLTQREVGEHIGVTQMQVSRILSRIHHRLRDQLTDTTGLRPPEPGDSDQADQLATAPSRRSTKAGSRVLVSLSGGTATAEGG